MQSPSFPQGYVAELSILSPEFPETGRSVSWSTSTDNVISNLWRMRVKRFLVASALALLVVSCADTHKVVRSDASPGARIDANSTIYIAVPFDGVYGATTYRGSGQNTA